MCIITAIVAFGQMILGAIGAAVTSGYLYNSYIENGMVVCIHTACCPESWNAFPVPPSMKWLLLGFILDRYS